MSEEKKGSWIVTGLVWGVMMYVFSNLISYFMDGEITKRKLIVGIPIWIIGGLIFGLVTRGVKRKQKNKQ